MKQLASYLNDHLAGSVSAIELLNHLIDNHQGKPLEKFFATLRDDVRADQETLRKIMQNFRADESAVRQAGAWMMEKFARAKTAAVDEKDELGLLASFEALVLGITGKQLLWRSLSAAFASSPLLKGVDLSQLEERAIEQIERAEAKRLEVAREALLRDL